MLQENHWQKSLNKWLTNVFYLRKIQKCFVPVTLFSYHFSKPGELWYIVGVWWPTKIENIVHLKNINAYQESNIFVNN